MKNSARLARFVSLLCGAVPAVLLAMPAQAGSLYEEKNFRPLTADNKAFRVGDIVTIQVIESASASTNADTSTRRANNLSASLGHGDGKVASADLAATGVFDGGGRTQRAGKLLAQLSATVREVFGNGDLRVAGEQLLTLNDEQQRIYLEGRVRSQDISDANVVLSSRLADARIVYLGDGDLSERQRRSWWRKCMDWLGL